MPRKNGVSVETVSNRLPQVISKLPNAVDDVLDKGILDIVGSAKRIAVMKGVFDTGTLVGEIQEDSGARRPGHREAVSGVEYSAPNEYGRHGVAARPYMGPAMEENRDAIIANVGRAIKGTVK